MARPPNPAVIGKNNQPTKRTPKVLNDILDAVRSGATQALAAQYAGIHKDTLNQWLKEGENADEDNPLAEFYVEFHRARGQQAKVTLEKIRAIADNVQSWQGHAWFLEHTFPKEFGKSIFGGDPSEVPEIRHVIEIVRDSGEPTEDLPAPAQTTRYQLSGPNGDGVDSDADDDVTAFPHISPAD